MSDDKIIQDPLLEVYLFETYHLIEQLEEIIIECEKNNLLTTNAINEIFRIMHTIKGSSAMMEFNNISSLAHSLEDLFFFIRETRHVDFDFKALSDLVLLGIDFIKNVLSKIENSENSIDSADELITNIKNYLSFMQNTAKEKIETSCNAVEDEIFNTQTKYFAKIFFDEDCEMEDVRAYAVIHNLKKVANEVYHIPSVIIENSASVEYIRKQGFLIYFSTYLEKLEIEELLNRTLFLNKLSLEEIDEYPQEIKCDNTKKEQKSPDLVEEKVLGNKDHISSQKTVKQQSLISVNVTKLDMLLDLVGEIVITEAMVVKNPDLEGLSLNNFNRASRQLRKLTNELQSIVMSIRMVPLATTFNKMNRIVRDMSKKLNKDVKLRILGEDTEVDKHIIDNISDPLMHLVRNALDHGLEQKEERIKAGKNEVGNLTLEAKNDGHDIYIIISDDGRGLDRKKIYDKSKRQGLVTKAENELSDKEIFSFIFIPGFSTNENITEFSGRGVGMDVVKKNIDSIGGSITIESTEGKGTSVYIKIPLTLSIIDGMELGIGKSKYTIPITCIRESFKAKNEDIVSDSDGNELIMIRGKCYPVLRLYKLFNIETDITSINKGIMILVEGDCKTACLLVDELIGELQVVVKALPPYIKKTKGIGGCTILGDGNISLIIDINDILSN